MKRLTDSPLVKLQAALMAAALLMTDLPTNAWAGTQDYTVNNQGRSVPVVSLNDAKEKKQTEPSAPLPEEMTVKTFQVSPLSLPTSDQPDANSLSRTDSPANTDFENDFRPFLGKDPYPINKKEPVVEERTLDISGTDDDLKKILGNDPAPLNDPIVRGKEVTLSGPEPIAIQTMENLKEKIRIANAENDTEIAKLQKAAEEAKARIEAQIKTWTADYESNLAELKTLLETLKTLSQRSELSQVTKKSISDFLTAAASAISSRIPGEKNAFISHLQRMINAPNPDLIRRQAFRTDLAAYSEQLAQLEASGKFDLEQLNIMSSMFPTLKPPVYPAGAGAVGLWPDPLIEIKDLLSRGKELEKAARKEIPPAYATVKAALSAYHPLASAIEIFDEQNSSWVPNTQVRYSAVIEGNAYYFTGSLNKSADGYIIVKINEASDADTLRMMTAKSENTTYRKVTVAGVRFDPRTSSYTADVYLADSNKRIKSRFTKIRTKYGMLYRFV